VDYVVDGDTVRLDNGDPVRLIGINATELRHDGHAAERWSRQAKDALAQWVEDRRVVLRPGVKPRDRHRRRLAYLHLPDGTDVQKRLLERGLAFAVVVPPDVRHGDDYLAAEQIARKARRGLWSDEKRLFRKPRSISTRDKGRFRLLRGKVRRVVRGKRKFYIKLDGPFTVKVPYDAWREYWGGNPDRVRGKTIEVRGWVWKDRYGYFLSAAHPVMLQGIATKRR